MENVCKNLTWKLKFVILLENFRLKVLSNKPGILTGYYEPEINVSFKKTKKFNVPILRYNKNYEQLDRNKIESNFKMQDVYYGQIIKLNYFFYKSKVRYWFVRKQKKIKINYGGNNKKNTHQLEDF